MEFLLRAMLLMMIMVLYLNGDFDDLIVLFCLMQRFLVPGLLQEGTSFRRGSLESLFSFLAVNVDCLRC